MNQIWVKYLPEIIREWLEGRQQLQKIVGNTGWLLFDRILRMVLGVTIGAWIARYLGPSQFGELAYVLSFVAFFQVVAGLEAGGFIVRDIAQKRGDPSVVLGTALWLRLFSSLFLWAFAVLLVFMLHPADRQLILLTAVVGATLVFQTSDIIDLWFQSQTQSRRTVVVKFVSYLFSNGVKIVLLVVKAPLVAFAGVMSLEAAAFALGLTIAYRRFPTTTRWKADFAQAKKLLNQCWPFVASGLMITAFSRIDQIMLKEMLGERELGIYAAALPISQAWHAIPATLVTSLAPYVAQKKDQGEKPYQEVLVKIFRLFAIVALLGALLTVAISPWIIKLLYGSQYQSAALVLSIYVFVNLFVFQGTAQYLWVINNNLRILTLFGAFVSVIVCVILNSILIKRLGILGAPISTLLTECVSVVLIPCLLRRDLFDLYKRAFLFIKPKHDSIC